MGLLRRIVFLLRGLEQCRNNLRLGNDKGSKSVDIFSIIMRFLCCPESDLKFFSLNASGIFDTPKI
jgi:hypothetical protein